MADLLSSQCPEYLSEAVEQTIMSDFVPKECANHNTDYHTEPYLQFNIMLEYFHNKIIYFTLEKLSE